MGAKDERSPTGALPFSFEDDGRTNNSLRHLVICGEMMLMRLEELAPDDISLEGWREALVLLKNS